MAREGLGQWISRQEQTNPSSLIIMAVLVLLRLKQTDTKIAPRANEDRTGDRLVEDDSRMTVQPTLGTSRQLPGREPDRAAGQRLGAGLYPLRFRKPGQQDAPQNGLSQVAVLGIPVQHDGGDGHPPSRPPRPMPCRGAPIQALVGSIFEHEAMAIAGNPQPYRAFGIWSEEPTENTLALSLLQPRNRDAEGHQMPV